MAFWDVDTKAPKGLDDWKQSVHLACRWMIDRSMIHTPTPKLGPGSEYPHLKRYADWRGAFKGEYWAATGRWDVFAPMWHGGQAVKALAMAHRVLGEPEYLDAARRAADFILRHQVTDPGDEDFGLLLAYEDEYINTSANLETLDGLYTLSDVTGERRYAEAAVAACRWVIRKAFMPDKGLMRDEYNRDSRRFREPYINPATGRLKAGFPGIDDGVMVTAWRLTGERAFLDVAVRVAERLLADEDPPGNWCVYPPSNPNTRVMHPRTAYWSGRPLWLVAKATGESRYLDACRRAAEWYTRAMRLDGGMFRDTRDDFITPSFGQATSGISCAAILWSDLIREFGDTRWTEPIGRALRYCYAVQFSSARDPNLQGAVLEKTMAPNGSDAAPWYLRDIGTFFYVQAVCQVMADQPELLGGTGATPAGTPVSSK